MTSESSRPPGRLYVLIAAESQSALVLRRGPSEWWHLVQWDLTTLTLTPGAWFHGSLYPRRCDVSADGQLFAYFARKSSSRPEWPESYCAVSKAPWLEALVAWKTGGTWAGSCEFSSIGELSISACIETTPFHGSYPRKYSMAPMHTDWAKRDVWNELKRGWHYASADDPMVASIHGKPNVVLRHRQPASTGGLTLGLIHRGVDFGQPGIEGVQLEYFLQDSPKDVIPINDAAWADWDRQGRLLMATRDGGLTVYECKGTRLRGVWSEALRDETPNPQPAPDWAGHW